MPINHLPDARLVAALFCIAPLGLTAMPTARADKNDLQHSAPAAVFGDVSLGMSAEERAKLLDEALDRWQNGFNPEIGSMRAGGGGPGYHTRTTPGQPVHSNINSATYAQLLLMRGRPEDVARASLLLDGLVALQVTDPASEHYGLWGWFVEEPPGQMAPADWNWADFIGAKLVEILKANAHALDADLVRRIQDALRHASACIVKRNVGPEYTNICTMGAAVTLATGELLGDGKLVAYGRRRLAAQRAALEAKGGVPEYNSPAYGTVMVHELERVLRLVSDSAARADAEWIHHRMWDLISSQFHPGTAQWAGAQDRQYGDTLHESIQTFFRIRTGLVFPETDARRAMPNPDDLNFSTEAACPPEFLSRFRAPAGDSTETVQTWMQPGGGKPAIVLHTWLSPTATLGSVNEGTTWVQRRPITAFWRDGEGGVATAKVNLLKNGKEFASGRLRIRQKGPRLLAVLDLVPGQGDWHCHLDRPADGRFTASDLRLRISLRAADAARIDLPPGEWIFHDTPRPDERVRSSRISQREGGWILSAGSHRFAVHPGEVMFDGKPGRWEAGAVTGGVAMVDAVLHSGEARAFSPSDLGETFASFGIELLNSNEKQSAAPVRTLVKGKGIRWAWLPEIEEIAAEP